MPRREDIKKILIIGSGPIVIGQACEFDYSGTQGAKALAAEGYEIVLVNSNPATIMTDPELARRTYVEPLEPATLRRIIERERPCAILPTLGGQTALNLALALDADGTLAKYGVELLGASPTAIRKAEDRQLFKEAMAKIGLECPRSGHAHSIEEAREIVATTGYPVILRPSFTLGGTGGDIVYRPEDLDTKVAWALSQSPTHEVLVEESVLGWKELEYEVIRDTSGNFIVVCTIENIDPMGVHTGDSITVAPAMTLTDKELQRLRDASRAIMAEIGVVSGGANVQFAICPKTGRVVVIEMNPRVSRSSALASKATGYPIAKVTAKLAVGYQLPELKNDMTGTSAAFEPAIDYVVVKWPRFAFEKFPGADPRLGTQMKSVGESMSIGRTLPEALQKAVRSLETGRDGLVSLLGRVDYIALAETPARVRDLSMEAPPEPSFRESREIESAEALRQALAKLVAVPTPDRLLYVADAMREPASMTDEQLYELTKIDPWFLAQIRRIVQAESRLRPTPESIREAKRLGFSDAQIAEKIGWTVEQVRSVREEHGILPTYLRVDTCAGELATDTAYFYSSYETKDEAEPSDRRKIVILGGGPNRIGQGIEFDYCCVHAAFALRELGFETVMVNCNPETVSTDYDTSDRLYFEPLTFESALSICQREASKGTLEGVIVQFGGQTPLKLAVPLANAGIKLLGTSADAIDRAEDRERFDALLSKLGLKRPRGGIARGVSDAFRVAKEIGYPVLVRPSYVLGGRAMMICHSDEDLSAYVALAVEAAREAGTQTILVDEFLKDAVEVDVDSLSDGKEVVIGGVMQHIEEAGVHSGDSSSVLPPHSLPPEIVASIEEQTRQIALELGVVGLMNVQFAVKDGVVYVLEVNPRASRTVPFVSKATGRPLAKIAAKLMAGKTLRELGLSDPLVPKHVAVKESVFPFAKFPGVDTVLGPEMRSTGEVMGMAPTFGRAFGKSLLASGVDLTKRGRAFISVKDEDKPAACAIARKLRALGFTIVATEGTAKALERAHVPAEVIKKVGEGSPHVVDAIRARTMTLVVNTTIGAKEIRDSYAIRRQTLLANIPYFTTMSAAMAAVEALEAGSFEPDSPSAASVRSLQEWHGEG